MIEENSPLRKVKQCNSSIFIQKLNLIESQCLVNLKSKSFSKSEHIMDNITVK